MKRFVATFAVGLVLVGVGSLVPTGWLARNAAAATAGPPGGPPLAGWPADWQDGRLGAAAVPYSLGVNIGFTNPGRWPGVMRELAASGVRWIRMDFGPDNTPMVDGRYDFSKYDRLLAALERYRMRALWILDYVGTKYQLGHPLNTAAQRRAYCHWVAAAMRHFRGHGIIWEMWNEPNGGGGAGVFGTCTANGIWGGADDGALHLPITRIQLGLQYNSEKKKTGRISFSDITLQKARGGSVQVKVSPMSSQQWGIDLGPDSPGARGSVRVGREGGNAAVILSYYFTHGGAYMLATRRVSLDSYGVLRFAVRSAEPQSMLYRIEDSSGQTFQFGTIWANQYSRANHWQLLSIPLGRWLPRAVAYAKLAVAVGKTIRRVAPRELYVGPGLAGAVDLKFLRTCFRAGALRYWDAVSVHPYRPVQTPQPESVAANYARLHKLIAQYAPPGKNIPIISSEWGYSSSAFDGHEKEQARYVAREFLMNLYQGIPVSIYYDWNDGPPPANTQEKSYGLVHYYPDRNPPMPPKVAYFAVKNLATQLRGCRFVQRLPVGGPNDYVLLFADAQAKRIAAWKTGDGTQTVMVPLPVGTYRLTNELGKQTRALAVSPGTPGIRVELCHDPEYIVQQ